MRGAPIGGVQLGFPILVGVPFLFQEGREGRSRRGRRKEGGAAPSLIQFGLAMGGHPCGPPLLSTKAREGPLLPPGGGGSGNLPVLQKIPESFRNIPVSEYNLLIYNSLPLDHFETPRHVRDLIWDSEQHSVTKSHNSYNTKSSSNVKRADPTSSRTM